MPEIPKEQPVRITKAKTSGTAEALQEIVFGTKVDVDAAFKSAKRDGRLPNSSSRDLPPIHLETPTKI